MAACACDLSCGTPSLQPEVFSSYSKLCYLSFFLQITCTVSIWEKRVLFFLCLCAPQFANPDFMESISDVVDGVIQNCPIDVRRPLYKV